MKNDSVILVHFVCIELHEVYDLFIWNILVSSRMDYKSYEIRQFALPGHPANHFSVRVIHITDALSNSTAYHLSLLDLW
jgi:hypothetical protein